MTSRERRVLRAAGRAQRETGAPLMVHPGRDPAPWTRSCRAGVGRGGPWPHDHRAPRANGPRSAELVALARRGLWLSLDTFGLETAFYPLNPATVMPNDGGRIGLAEAVIAAGFGAACCSPRTSARSTGWPRSGATATTTCCATSSRCWSRGARPVGGGRDRARQPGAGSSPGKAPARSPAAARPYQFWTERSLRWSCWGSSARRRRLQPRLVDLDAEPGASERIEPGTVERAWTGNRSRS